MAKMKNLDVNLICLDENNVDIVDRLRIDTERFSVNTSYDAADHILKLREIIKHLVSGMPEDSEPVDKQTKLQVLLGKVQLIGIKGKTIMAMKNSNSVKLDFISEVNDLMEELEDLL